MRNITMKKGFGTQIMKRSLSALAGAGAGGMIGFYTTLAFVVAKARAGYYIFAVQDITDVGFEMVIVLLGVVAGGVLGYRMPIRLLRAVLRGLVGLMGGGILGALAGQLIWHTEEGLWAGAIIVSALTLLAAIAVFLRTSTRRSLSRIDLSAASLTGLVVSLAFLTGPQQPKAVEIPEIEPAPLPPASAVDEVVFIVGDAGATVPDRSPLLEALQYDVERWSATLARDSAVSIVYPGDLVYPVGVRNRSHPQFPQDSTRLWNQIELVGGPEARRYSTTGLFLTGNHDWGGTNNESGLERVHNLEEQLDLARRSGYTVMLVPEAGASGPAVRDLRDNIRFVFLDTHWFLQNPSVVDRSNLLEQLAKALETAGDRHVIIVSHHPYRSAGPHGVIIPGYYTLGLDFLLRKAGALVQDLNSPVYEELREGMKRVFVSAAHPPLVYAGGHDHSLQVLERQEETDPAYMLVSGSGSKVSDIQTLPGMHYGAGRPGYMMLLFRKDGAVDLFVVAGAPELLKCTAETEESWKACMTVGANSFDIVYGRTLAEAPDVPVLTGSTVAQQTSEMDSEPRKTVANVNIGAPNEPAAERAVAWWTRTRLPATSEITEAEADLDIPPPAVPARVLYHQPDTVTTTAGASYLAGRLHRLVLGTLNRHLWDIPVRLPVLDLDALGEELIVEDLTGGLQTVGLRLRGSNGMTYQFRNIVKNATRGLETRFERAALGEVFEDQIGSQFPLGAMVVTELLQAADVLVAPPRPVVMPNDDRLGAYRPYFAGRVGWIEIRPNERGDNQPGFEGSRKIVDGLEIYEELREDPTSYVAARTYLRARFIDFLVGDWDRHSDNWRWARFEDDGRARWEPIPRDRDWAFTRSDGLVSKLSPVIFPRYVGFSDEITDLARLAGSGYHIDHRVLSTVPREVFGAEARRLRATLSDSVLTAALAALPPPYLAMEHERLLRELRARRDQLPRVADDFYELLAQTIHIYGYDGVVDTVRLEPAGNDRFRIRVWTEGRGEAPHVDRTLDRSLTREIHLFIDASLDIVEQPEGFPIPVLIHLPAEADGEVDNDG